MLSAGAEGFALASPPVSAQAENVTQFDVSFTSTGAHGGVLLSGCMRRDAAALK